MCDFTCSNSGGKSDQKQGAVDVHRETKNTIRRIAELTNDSEAIIVDKAISEYLTPELQDLTDHHSSRNELTVEYNGEVVYTSSFGYNIDSDELVEIVSEYVLSEGGNL